MRLPCTSSTKRLPYSPSHGVIGQGLGNESWGLAKRGGNTGAPQCACPAPRPPCARHCQHQSPPQQCCPRTWPAAYRPPSTYAQSCPCSAWPGCACTAHTTPGCSHDSCSGTSQNPSGIQILNLQHVWASAQACPCMSRILQSTFCNPVCMPLCKILGSFVLQDCTLPWPGHQTEWACLLARMRAEAISHNGERFIPSSLTIKPSIPRPL